MKNKNTNNTAMQKPLGKALAKAGFNLLREEQRREVLQLYGPRGKQSAGGMQFGGPRGGLLY